MLGTSSDLDGVRLSLLVCGVPALKLDPTTVLAPLSGRGFPLGLWQVPPLVALR